MGALMEKLQELSTEVGNFRALVLRKEASLRAASAVERALIQLDIQCIVSREPALTAGISSLIDSIEQAASENRVA
ncbi:hypothetical protein CL629_04765 [bacterium]|nr:hypothetical protein [bacterium]|tara:strand:- start:1921 stop:2148 length:228 start_codon:yes stop_codon:yes gene_type:complete